MKEKVIEFGKLLIYPLFVYLNIDVEAVSILSAFMLADGFFGGIKAHRINQGFSFKMFLWGIVLKIIILSIPIWVALGGLGLGMDLTILVHMVIKVMIANELISVLSNIYCIKTGKEVKKIDAVSMMLLALRNSIYKGIQSVIKKIEQSNNCNPNDSNT